jgi:hypothetical protein
MSSRNRSSRPRHGDHPSGSKGRSEPAGTTTGGSSGAWIPLLLGIFLVWPWFATFTCGITGVCLSPGSHRKDGWLSAHKIESSGWRLMFGVMAIAGGINGLASGRRK